MHDDTDDVAQHYDERTRVALAGSHQASPEEITFRKICNLIKKTMIERACTWVKVHSTVVGQAVGQSPPSITQLDLGHGKGGDIWKSAMAGVTYLVGMDPSKESLAEADRRLGEIQQQHADKKEIQNLTVALCPRADAFDLFLAHDIHLTETLPRTYNIISAQFSLHYGCFSIDGLKRIMFNVSKLLDKRGVFLATIMDACMVYKQWTALGRPDMIKNDLYSIDWTLAKTQSISNGSIEPRTGTTIRFTLGESVVNCREYLIHPTELVQVARDYGLVPMCTKHERDDISGNFLSLLERCGVRDVPSRTVRDTLRLYTSVMFVKL